MKRAMLIASSEFSPDSGIEPLRFPLNDVAALEVTLRSDDFGFEVEKLINAPQSVAAEKLEAWISKADYDDLMLIYFSGHGKLSRARELFLTCANTKSTSLIATGLKYTLLTDLIREHSLQKSRLSWTVAMRGVPSRVSAGMLGTPSKRKSVN